MVLYLDTEEQPWLMVARSSDGRLSILHRNTREDADTITTHPLADPVIWNMSRAEAFLVVEEPQNAPVYIRTTGLDQVISYLRWLESEQARVLRDARFWPKGGALDLADAGNEALERFRAVEHREHAGPRYLVPSTKPQIEFAIRGQGGVSLYPTNGF